MDDALCLEDADLDQAGPTAQLVHEWLNLTYEADVPHTNYGSNALQTKTQAQLTETLSLPVTASVVLRL